MYGDGLPTLVHTLVTLRGRPVVGALVLLNLNPTNDTNVSSLPMVDDGRADPDLVAGDGIYSAYIFNHVGPINVEVEVSIGLYSHIIITIIILITIINIILMSR